MGGSVKRSLAMVLLGCGVTIAKTCGLDDATGFDCEFLAVHSPLRSLPGRLLCHGFAFFDLPVTGPSVESAQAAEPDGRAVELS